MSGSATRVTVVGESLIDHVSGRGTRLTHPGGSPMNVAYGLGRLGIDTTLVTSLGDDREGRQIREHLEGAGVRLFTPGPTPSATSTAIATIGEHGDAHYSFDITWELDPLLDSAPVADLVHAGSIALVLGGGGLRTRELLQARAERSIISVDPNIRQSIIPDTGHARSELLEAMSGADIVKLSIEDARWLFGDVDEHGAADRLLAAGTSVVAVTLDAHGSLLATARARVPVDATPVAVADTVGAGDAYMSGLIAAVLTLPRVRESTLRELRSSPWNAGELGAVGAYASAVAGLTVARRGANPPTAAAVAALGPGFRMPTPTA